MKVYVKYGWTDDYGRVRNGYNLKWFETKKEAKDWVKAMKAGNGGYFEVAGIYEGNYENWERLTALEKEIEELRKEFY